MTNQAEPISANRHLCIEPLESRMPLSADFIGDNASDLLAALLTPAESAGFGSGSLSELVAPPLERQSTSANHGVLIGDEPMVRFRVDWTDPAGNPASQVSGNEFVVANIYVQDISPDPNRLGHGGVFQAVVDLQFGTNLQPNGEVAISHDFGSRLYNSGINTTTIRGVGGTNRRLIPAGGKEQLLLQAPFRVMDTASPVSLQVTPSVSVPEPVLLYGINVPIPSRNVVANSPEFLFAQTNSDSQDAVVRPEIANDPLVVSGPTNNGNFGIPVRPIDRNPVATRDTPLTFVSFVAVESPWVGNAKTDWLRSPIPDNSISQRRQSSDRLWHELDELKPQNSRRIVPDLDTESTHQDDNGRFHDSGQQADTSGLFFDDTLFLEGAIVESFESRFKLRMRLFDFDPKDADREKKERVAKNGRPNANDLIDIAAILRPKSSPADAEGPSEQPNDEASTDEALAEWDTAEWDTAEWNRLGRETGNPERSQEDPKPARGNIPFGRVEDRDGNGSDIESSHQTTQSDPTAIATVQ